MTVDDRRRKAAQLQRRVRRRFWLHGRRRLHPLFLTTDRANTPTRARLSCVSSALTNRSWPDRTSPILCRWVGRNTLIQSINQSINHSAMDRVVVRGHACLKDSIRPSMLGCELSYHAPLDTKYRPFHRLASQPWPVASANIQIQSYSHVRVWPYAQLSFTTQHIAVLWIFTLHVIAQLRIFASHLTQNVGRIFDAVPLQFSQSINQSSLHPIFQPYQPSPLSTPTAGTARRRSPTAPAVACCP